MKRLALALLFLAGCSSQDELEARLLRTELWVGRLEKRLDELQGVAARVQGLETLQAAPPSAERERLEARLAGLEAELLALKEQLAQAGRAPTATPARPGGPLELPGPPDDVMTLLPEPGRPVPVLSVGSGGLLLVQGKNGKLASIALLGIEPPARPEEYADSPLLKKRHEPALGKAALETELAFEQARMHLERLLGGGQVVLDYGGKDVGPVKQGEPTPAYVSIRGEGGLELDLGAAMLKDGFALASATSHARARDYTALEAEARGAKRGLFTAR